MIDRGRKNVLGVLVHAVDYDAAVARVMQSARRQEPLGVSALAVHGVMEGVNDRTQLHRLNELEMVVPDGQPVRWALNVLHKSSLAERVYGPELTLRLCEAAEREGTPVYFYGSKAAVLERLEVKLRERFPRLEIAGIEPSLFRRTTEAEQAEVVERIRASGAKITFVGLGCPRQEVWAYEYRHRLSMPVIAVGAAFDFHAGLLRQAPPVMQRWGLEWAFRLVMEPRRLWRRYLFLNTQFLGLFLLQAAGLWTPSPASAERPEVAELYG